MIYTHRLVRAASNLNWCWKNYIQILPPAESLQKLAMSGVDVGAMLEFPHCVLKVDTPASLLTSRGAVIRFQARLSLVFLQQAKVSQFIAKIATICQILVMHPSYGWM